MFGVIHIIVRSMVTDNYGDHIWKTILKKAELDESADFQKTRRYPDETTTKLIATVGQILGGQLVEVLDSLGREFFSYLLKEGHKKSLQLLGDDFPSMINNLDSHHAIIQMATMEDMDPPSFRCDAVNKDGSAKLHYYSKRAPTMLPFVMGMLKSIARELYGLQLKCQVIAVDEPPPLSGPLRPTHATFQLSGVLPPEKIYKMAEARSKNITPVETFSDDTLVSPKDFCDICPFHLVFDKDLTIRQCGANIQKLCQEHSLVGRNMKQIARVLIPRIELSYEAIATFRNSIYLLEIYANISGPALLSKSVTSVKSNSMRSTTVKLQGEMVVMEEEGIVLFVGAPRLGGLQEMHECNLFLSDIPIYDVTREIVLINQQIMAEGEISKMLDVATTETVRVSSALEEEKEKTDALLYQMLPKKVANTLRDGGCVKSEKFESVTIFFSDIVSFTTIASGINPVQVVDMLNQLYSKLDQLTSKWGVFKVETIGDAYMVVGGAPEVTSDHAEKVVNFAVDMVMSANEVTVPDLGKNPIQVRTGIHTGPVWAGVVGDRMPRYCLSGDTVLIANLLQEKGRPNSIHISPTTHKLLVDKPGFVFEDQGEMIPGSRFDPMFTRYLLATPDRQLKLQEKKIKKKQKLFKKDSCTCILL